MTLKINLLRKVLQNIIDDIDAGNSNCTEEELEEAIDALSKLNKGIPRISKRQACDDILHCTERTFDNYVAMNLIPKGHKTKGFKELCWREKDFDKAKEYMRKYRKG